MTDTLDIDKSRNIYKQITNISCCFFCCFLFHAHTVVASGSTNIWPTMFGKWDMADVSYGSRVVCHE